MFATVASKESRFQSKWDRVASKDFIIVFVLGTVFMTEKVRGIVVLGGSVANIKSIFGDGIVEK